MARRTWNDLSTLEKLVFGPFMAYTYQGPDNKLPGILGRIHEAIDPVKAYGGYGGVLGAAMMGPGLNEWHGRPDELTVFTNPSVAKLDRLTKAMLKSGRNPQLRWVVDNEGTLYVGDALNFTHRDLNPAHMANRSFGYITREGPNAEHLAFEAFQPYSHIPGTEPVIEALKIPRAGYQQQILDRLGSAP